MSPKTTVYLCMFVGSVLGGYLPMLWGGSVFSFTSVLTSAVGGAIGVFLGLKISN